jgi:hypothetical protein
MSLPEDERMVELPESVRPLFVAARWHPGRRVEVSPAVPANHPAAGILAEFGGLTVAPPEDAAGEECGLDDLVFRQSHRADSVADRWENLLGTRLISVADIHHGHAAWYVAADRRVFGRSYIHDAFWLAGRSFGEAVERSLLGRRVRPMLRPDQSSVTLYGIRFTADSPELYRYR